jgi:ABC-type glutathione transport system ATPase component
MILNMVNNTIKSVTERSESDVRPSSGGGAILSLRDARVLAADGRTLLRLPALDIGAGERIVLTGPSGSGKSLLLSTLTGRWPAGLRFEGERTAALSRIGFVPQRGLDALHPLIPLATQLRRATGASRERVAAVLGLVGLADPALHGRRPAELSGGQAQRAAVALAALTEAPLILADEPTSALDHDSRDRTLRLLGDIVGARQTLVVATHDGAVVEALGTRHLAVSHGAVTEIPVAARPEGR